MKEVLKKFSNFLSEELKINKDKFIYFDGSADRVDEFYCNASTDMKKSPELVLAIEVVCKLSHGNASVERSFSVRKTILQSNISTEVLYSHRINKDHTNTHNVKPETFTIAN